MWVKINIETKDNLWYAWSMAKLVFMFFVSLAVAVVLGAILVVFLRRLRQIEDDFWSSNK